MEPIGGVIRKKAGDAPNKRLHSEAHVLADEISAYFNERKKFGMYLGVIKRVGVPKARALYAAIKSEGGNVRNPRRFFVWLTGEKKDDRLAS